MKNRRRAAVLGSLVLTAALTFGTAVPASALWDTPSTLKQCEKNRKEALANPYWDVVGPCIKTKPAGYYTFYMYHY